MPRSNRRIAFEKSSEPVADQRLRLSHDAADQLLDGWDIVNQARDHAAAPGSGLHLPLAHYLRIDSRDELADIGDLECAALLFFDFQDPGDTGILEDALRVPERAHDKPRIKLGRRKDRVFDI